MADKLPTTSFDEDDGLKKSRDLAKKLENETASNADDEVRQLYRNRVGKKPQSAQAVRDKETTKKTRRKKGAVVALGFSGLLLVGAIMLLSPSLLLVNMKEQLTNDLNDSTLAYYTYAQKVLAGQVGQGCQDDTIECKFKTMSPMLKERYEQRKFTVTGTENPTTGRTAVSAVRAPDGSSAVSPASFTKLMESGRASSAKIFDVFNPKNALFHDRKFAERLYERFHLPHRFILSGSTQQEVEDSFDRNLWSDDDSIDGYGRGVYSLDYLAQTDNEWRGKIYSEVIKKANTHLAIACGLRTYATIAEGAVMRARSVTLARFAMQYLSAADAIKAGNTRGHIETSFLSDRLSASGSADFNGTDGSSFRVPAMYEVPDTERLPNGRSYMNDSSTALAIMELLGGAPGVPGTTYLKNSSTSVGGTGEPAQACKRGLSNEQKDAEKNGSCLTPGIVSLASYIGPIGGAVVASQVDKIEKLCQVSYEAIVELAKVVTRPEATLALPGLLPIALEQEARRFSSQTYGIAAQDAVFAGAGVLFGDVAQSIGMRPASKQSLRQYIATTQPQYEQLVKHEQTLARSTPWDVTNKYSFIGSVFRTVGLHQISPDNYALSRIASTFMATPLAVLKTTVSPAATALYSHPINTNLDRLLSANECRSAGGLDVNPDFSCNLRYSMSEQDLNKSVDDVLSYMTSTHPDDAGDAPTADTGADPEVGERMQKEHSEGSAATYIDPATGKPNKYTQYAKFLQFCADRNQPLGVVGMYSEYTPSEFVQNDGVNGDPRYSHRYQAPAGSSDDEPEELPWAYYGLAWGNQSDQDWMTGKKCLEDSQMLQNFRAYTVMCRALAGMSGSHECWQEDARPWYKSGSYARNDILFVQDDN